MVDKPVTTEAECTSCERPRTFRLDVVDLETYTCVACGAEQPAEDVLEPNDDDKTPAIRPVDRTPDSDDDEDYYYPVGPM